MVFLIESEVWGLTGIYFLGWLLNCWSFLKDRPRLGEWGGHIFFLGCLVHLFINVSLYIEKGLLPFSSLSSIFLFLSLIATLSYFLIDFFKPNSIFSVIFPALSILLISISNFFSATSLIPFVFLESTPVFGKILLLIHVTSIVSGYLFFGVASIVSLFFLYQENLIKSKRLGFLSHSKLPSLSFLDDFNYKSIIIGFFLMTVGLFLGISMGFAADIEGKSQFDLRFLLPMVTWVIYGLYLIDRTFRGNRGWISSIWSLLGFISAICSFLYEIVILLNKTEAL